MANQIAGPGQGLPPPQALYPRQLWTTPFTAPTNHLRMAGGQALPIPAGTWVVESGTAAPPVCAIQWKDPVRLEWWTMTPPQAPGAGPGLFGMTVRSDGFNFRIANLSGMPTGATVTAGGANYVASTTHVVASDGGSKWRAIVGGSLGAVTIIDGGRNYSIPPLVFVPVPPAPGIPATGTAVLTNGVVTGINWWNPGAGYTFPPQILIVPDPYDPVLLAAADRDDKMTTSDIIRDAKASVVLAGQGSVTAVLLMQAGTPLDTAPTLTITGQGTGATATVQPATWVAPEDDSVVIQPASGP